LSSGKIPAGIPISCFAVNTGTGHDKILFVNEENRTLEYYLADMSNGNKMSVMEFKDRSFANYLTAGSKFFSGNFTEKSARQILMLDQTWRLDLKIIQPGPNGFTILSQADFATTNNPKHFEFTQIIPGNFLGLQQDQLLILMRNCEDPAFDGRFCNSFENQSSPHFLFFLCQQEMP
jgi:hypothetical protein